MWPFNRRPTPSHDLQRLLELENRVVLLEDRFEEQLDALKREAARVEQANRRAEARAAAAEPIAAAAANGHTPMTSWDIARKVNLNGTP